MILAMISNSQYYGYIVSFILAIVPVTILSMLFVHREK